MLKKRIALVEPFFTGSHQRWIEELRAHSRHSFDLYTLPGRYWKWRMHGAAITLAEQVLASRERYDLILASDMLDLAVFLSLIRRRFAQTPTALYFHENQLCYPWSPRDKDVAKKRDLHYAFINYSSALAADRVYFNSDYHRNAFLDALPDFLSAYPDFKNKESIQSIRKKSETLWLGLDLRAFDAFRPGESRSSNSVPLLLWNHRWEYDKNPKGFCKLLLKLHQRGIDFEVALLGDRFEEEPPYFAQLRQKLGSRIVAYGRAESFADYAGWLWRADILPVTSRQDFFGGSVVEAIYCDTHPILPNRLAYRDHVSSETYPENYFTTIDQATDRVASLIQSGKWTLPCPFSDSMRRYDWSQLIADYDRRLGA
ncbi:DUF3524 domain-containing protein [Pelagicoccus sp. SDUM812003]|uniref:tRNA-queuosine alpha-mannosyltransferase domain-containing protein n=1 Tax=Pelagicoccus sp. SDUM812003 TaxID=3041267 RepID=UPI0028103FF9|nr:DUF3524 domain-containing protein [Pelagicoccus sp. SDUM812003]MDQ8203049.1 DUF3524 domain-containing protein [Pelagicoccus sp. SDUM812003]